MELALIPAGAALIVGWHLLMSWWLGTPAGWH